MTPAIAIQEVLTRSIIGAGETPAMGQEFGWVEFVGKNWGLGAVVLGLFGWSTVKLAGWAGPRIDRWLEKRNSLVEKIEDRVVRALDGQEEIKESVTRIDRRVDRIASVIGRNCGKTEPPDSDTELGKTSVHE